MRRKGGGNKVLEGEEEAGRRRSNMEAEVNNPFFFFLFFFSELGTEPRALRFPNLYVLIVQVRCVSTLGQHSIIRVRIQRT